MISQLRWSELLHNSLLLHLALLNTNLTWLIDRAATRDTSASKNFPHWWKYIHFDATLSFSISFISLYISGMFHLESCFVLSSKCGQWGAVRCRAADNVTDLSWWGQTSRLTGPYLNKSEISKITILLWSHMNLEVAQISFESLVIWIVLVRSKSKLKICFLVVCILRGC